MLQLRKKYLLLVLVIYCSNNSFAAINNTIPKISRADFKKLTICAYDYLKQNVLRLGCQKNESGFIRINIPLNKTIKSQHSIEKLRLNYWTAATGMNIEPESIHSHPNTFESFIVKGGYTHAIFKNALKEGEMYDLYRIFKDTHQKSFQFIESVALIHAEDQIVQAENIIRIDPLMIHKVLSTQPETLTLNAVIHEMDNHKLYVTDSAKTWYDVFLTENGSMDDIKTKREIIHGTQSVELIKKMTEYLSQSL